MTQWTKEDRDILTQLGAYITKAQFTIEGGDIIPLYRGVVILAKFGKMIDDLLVPAKPEVVPPPAEVKPNVPEVKPNGSGPSRKTR